VNIIDRIRSRFAAPPSWQLSDEVDASLRNDPRIAAATIAYVGPGGCGKTRASLDNALTCGFLYGLPVYVLDLNRELPKAKEAYAAHYRSASVLVFLQRRVIQLSSLEGFERNLQGIKARNPDGVYNPQSVWVCDEGLLLRERGEEGIVALSLQARNHGVTLHLAGQRLKVAHPSTAETMRAVVAWSGGTNPPTRLLGVDVTREELAQPRADRLFYVLGATGEKLTYDSSMERPLTLVAPCFPSKTPPRGFMAKVVNQ